MWRNLGRNTVGHKIRRDHMELYKQFNRHYAVLKIEYPSITKQALKERLSIYEPIRGKFKG